jgi:predicted Zn finger-like uncharacterized protein
MKIVCESCGAKYSIADDRVTGKVFKIRCKRCSEVIVVRGDQQAAPAAGAPAAAAQGQDAIWHVVVDGEQAGPYSPAQLGEMLNSGAVDWDAYVWTEGFDNWSPMRDVADLVALITGQGQPQAAAQAAPAYRPSQTQTLTGQPSMGADPFADDAGPSDAGLFGGGGAAPDLFGRGAQVGGYGGGAEVAASTPSPAPRVAPERALTGARNENSVLFSLKNLQALATGSGTPSAPAAAMGAGGGGGDRGAGFASGEGSGLIDIRALASTTGIGDGADAPGQKDELLSLGSQGGAFGTLGSPMLAPARDEGDGKQKTLIWALVVGVGFVCAAGVTIAYLLVSKPQASATPVAPAPLPPAPTAAPAAALAPPAPSEGELAAAKVAGEHEKVASKESEKSTGGGTSHSSKKHGGESASAKAAGSEPGGEPLLEPKKETSKPGGPRTIDDLLDGALNGSSKPVKKVEADDGAKSNLPMTPSRDDVLSAMNGVKSAVQACGKGGGGVATVTVNVAGATGHVTTAEVNGASGPAGSCIAQAVRKAQFNKFQQKVFKVTFPYKL